MYHRLRRAIEQNIAELKRPGSFAQNFVVSFSGSAIITAIGLVLTPVMSRIYPPAAYGQFAVFNSIVNNFNLLATLSYSSAIPLPERKRDALAIVQLNVVLALTAFFLVSVVLLLAGDWLKIVFQVEAVGQWIYVIPILLLLYNLSLVMSSWYIRIKAFRTRAGTDVATSVAGRTFTLGYGWWSAGHIAGLIIGDVFSKITLFISLLRSGFHHELGALRRTFSWKQIQSVAYRYREFPLYVLPGGYVGAMSGQLPIFMLTSGFGPTIVGLYSFAASLLEIPVALIGSGIAPVFYQKAAETYNSQPERLKEITLAIYNKLLYLGLLPLGFITIFGDWIFKYVFGEQWEMSGVFTAYLGYYYVFRLTSHCTGMIYNVLGRQNYGLVTNLLLLGARAIGLAIGIYYKDANLALLLFGLGSLLSAFATDLHILYLLRLPVWRIALRTIGLMCATLLLFKVMRYAVMYLFPEL